MASDGVKTENGYYEVSMTCEGVKIEKYHYEESMINDGGKTEKDHYEEIKMSGGVKTEKDCYEEGMASNGGKISQDCNEDLPDTRNFDELLKAHKDQFYCTNILNADDAKDTGQLSIDVDEHVHNKTEYVPAKKKHCRIKHVYKNTEKDCDEESMTSDGVKTEKDSYEESMTNGSDKTENEYYKEHADVSESDRLRVTKQNLQDTRNDDMLSNRPEHGNADNTGKISIDIDDHVHCKPECIPAKREHPNIKHFKRRFKCSTKGCYRMFVRKESLLLHEGLHREMIRPCNCIGCIRKTKQLVRNGVQYSAICSGCGKIGPIKMNNNNIRVKIYMEEGIHLRCLSCGVQTTTNIQRLEDPRHCTSNYFEISFAYLCETDKCQSVEFCTLERLFGHESNKHSKKFKSNVQIQCFGCHKTFESRCKLYYHRRICPAIAKPSTCPFCAVVYSSRSKLKNHIEHVHKTKSLLCDRCGMQFKWPSLLKTHMSEVHNIIDTPKHNVGVAGSSHSKCDLCGTHFESQSLLQQHLQDVHKHISTDTGTATEKPSLPASVILKTGHDCPVCGKNFKSRKLMVSHRTRVHCERKTQCTECGKLYKTSDDLNKHMVVHDENRTINKFHCMGCDKAFCRKIHLRDHFKNVHEGKKYPCPDCDKIYGSKYALTLHNKACHNAEGPIFQCSQCSKVFKSKLGFDLHKIKNTCHS